MSTRKVELLAGHMEEIAASLRADADALQEFATKARTEGLVTSTAHSDALGLVVRVLSTNDRLANVENALLFASDLAVIETVTSE